MKTKIYVGIIFRNGAELGHFIDECFDTVWNGITDNIDLRKFPLMQIPLEHDGDIIHLVNIYRKEGSPMYNVEVIVKEITLEEYPDFDERDLLDEEDVNI